MKTGALIVLLFSLSGPLPIDQLWHHTTGIAPSHQSEQVPRPSGGWNAVRQRPTAPNIILIVEFIRKSGLDA